MKEQYTKAKIEHDISHVFMMSAIRAIMVSHPNPNILKAHWDVQMANLYTDLLHISGRHQGKIDKDLMSIIHNIQESWESYIRTS